MTPDNVLEQMKAGFTVGGGRLAKPRRYVAGLLIAFADFFLELDTPAQNFKSLADFFGKYSQITEGVSTLTVRTPDGQKTIRPAYERAHRFFIFESKRLDYPRSQPYATGKWADYREWLDAMVGFSRGDLERIISETKDFVLTTLKPHVFNPLGVRIEPPIFYMLLRDFPFRMRATGETTGAAFQAAVFAFIRADAPHLQVESRKVRTGSARQAGIGDIDAWEGDRLVISAEVKHFVVDENILEDLDFFGSEVKQRAALGLVIAEDFRENGRAKIEETGLRALSLADLARIVSLWDPVKQRAAINAFQYVVVHKEQNGPLMERVDKFFLSVGFKVVNEEGITAAE
jgi:hypothetical protein